MLTQPRSCCRMDASVLISSRCRCCFFSCCSHPPLLSIRFFMLLHASSCPLCRSLTRTMVPNPPCAAGSSSQSMHPPHQNQVECTGQSPTRQPINWGQTGKTGRIRTLPRTSLVTSYLLSSPRLNPQFSGSKGTSFLDVDESWTGAQPRARGRSWTATETASHASTRITVYKPYYLLLRSKCSLLCCFCFVFVFAFALMESVWWGERLPDLYIRVTCDISKN